MSEQSHVSRRSVLRSARSASKAIVPFVLAIASLHGLMACSSDDASTNDAGTHDASGDGTVQPGHDGGADTATDDTGTSDAGTDSADTSTAQDTSVDTAPPPTGDAGEPCTPPNNACGPGLYCNANVCTKSLCYGKPEKALPYTLSDDFQTIFTIGPEKDNFAIIPTSDDCDSTTYPPIPNTGFDAGADSGFPSILDGGTQIVTYPSKPSCYEILYDPSCTNGTGGLCWAGAIVTNSAATAAAATNGNVTPSAVGVCVAQGATVISFSARSSLDGAVIKFGSTRPGACLKNPITGADGGPPDPTTEQTQCPGATEFYIALTSGWQRYTVSLPAGEPYNDEPSAGGGVWNGFSIVVEPGQFAAAGGAYIFVKDVVWGTTEVDVDAGAPDASGATDASGDAADASPE